MARMELVGCYCRNREAVVTLQALVEAGFDANIVTRRGAVTLQSCGYMLEDVPGGRPIRGPDGTDYVGRQMVTILIYVMRTGRRSEYERFYLVDPDPSHLLCDLVLSQGSLIGKELIENSAASTLFRPKTDAEKKKQQDENKKNDDKVRAEQEKVREEQRRERAAKRA